MQHFRSYLEGSEKGEKLKSELPEQRLKRMEDQSEAGPRELENIVYVKKWMRTRHAIMFRLSNKIVQVNF